ncbi:hypothetical protein ACFOW4_12800 [Micromonospora sp. GCM10011542]|uniref:hypothetical protein n=1 Tax=Micromonospora sp. GCM10011542 TaxID=3317337 RepID=UPI003621E114
MSLGQALMQNAPFWAVIFAAVALLAIGAVASSLRNARRAEAFLRARPAPADR